MAKADEHLNEAMLCVFSALFADMQEESELTGDEVRRAMWPKGVPKFAEVLAQNCCLALVGAAGLQPDIFERIGQALWFEIAEQVEVVSAGGGAS